MWADKKGLYYNVFYTVWVLSVGISILDGVSEKHGTACIYGLCPKMQHLEVSVLFYKFMQDKSVKINFRQISMADHKSRFCRCGTGWK